MLNSNIHPSLLESMPRLLLRKLPLTAPLAFQPRSVCFVPVFVPRVIRLEEKRNTNNREPQRIIWIERRLLHRLHGALQLTLPDVPVGSHGIRNQLDRHELVLSSRRQPRHRPGRRRHRPFSSLLRKHLQGSLSLIYFFTGSFTFSCVCPGGNANPSTASLKRTTTLSGVISALFTFTKALMTAFATSLRTSGVRHAFGSLHHATTKRNDDKSSSSIQCASLVFPCSLRRSLRRVVAAPSPSINKPPFSLRSRSSPSSSSSVVATYQAMCTNGIDARASVSTHPRTRAAAADTDARTNGRTDADERARTD